MNLEEYAYWKMFENVPKISFEIAFGKENDEVKQVVTDGFDWDEDFKAAYNV